MFLALNDITKFSFFLQELLTAVNNVEQGGVFGDRIWEGDPACGSSSSGAFS